MIRALQRNIRGQFLLSQSDFMTPNVFWYRFSYDDTPSQEFGSQIASNELKKRVFVNVFSDFVGLEKILWNLSLYNKCMWELP